MSWSSRFGALNPTRWSPFTSRGDSANTRISDEDFSYITKEDLARHDSNTTRANPPRRNSNLSSSRTTREHDILLFRHQKVSYPVHFPAYSIDDGELTIGDARDEAAKALNVADARRIRMFYKGRNLKDDNRLCRDDGFYSDTSAEILCVIGEPIKSNSYAPDGSLDADSEVDDNDQDDDNDDDPDGYSAAPGNSTSPADPAKKKKKKSRRKKKPPKSSSADGFSGGHVQNVEHLPVPTGAHPTHRTTSPSRSPASGTGTPRPATPQTPQQKLAAIADKFEGELLPQCKAYIDRPPTDKAKRDFEHKKLSETILAQVLLKLDAVETEGDDEARAKRKALVKEVQGWLGQLDSVVKGA